MSDQGRPPTHVCLDCGALGHAGGYHDHGGGNAGETIALAAIPAWVQSWERIEDERNEFADEIAHLQNVVGALRQACDEAREALCAVERVPHLRMEPRDAA